MHGRFQDEELTAEYAEYVKYPDVCVGGTRTDLERGSIVKWSLCLHYTGECVVVRVWRSLPQRVLTVSVSMSDERIPVRLTYRG